MKRIFTYSAIILAGLFLATSCLNEKPQYSQNSQIIFSSESNAQLALLGCYGYMTENTAYGQMWQEVPLVGSGLIWAQRNGADEDRLSSLAATPDNALISAAWRGMYKAICECNAFIEGMKSSELSEDVKTQMLGEAYFLRALGYYNLVSLFSDVPLKLVASSSDGIAMPRTPKEEVFAAIVTDLKEASKMKTSSDPGRANSWAAQALLGKVYYKMAMLGIDREANLTNAKTTFDIVYDAHVYDLEKVNYAGLFAPYNTPEYVAKSKEVIFQLNFNSSSTVCYNRGSNRFAPQASTSGINWGTYRVAKYAYDLHNGTYPGDPRVEVNFLTQWRSRSGNNQPNPKTPVGDKLCAADSTYAYPKRPYRAEGQPATSTIEIHLPYEIFSNPCNPTKAELDTYSGPYPAPVKNLWNSFLAVGNGEKYPYLAKLYDQGQVAQRSNKHLIVFRYAEMLLEMADVYNELNDTKRAVELANEVLKRARLCGGGTAQPADWSTSLSKEEVTEKLYFERIFELMGEPCLYDMVRIRGEKYLEKLLLKANNHDLTVGGNKSYEETSDRFCDRVYDEGQQNALNPDFLKKNLLLPIPSSEIDANSALTPADNNFGYNS